MRPVRTMYMALLLPTPRGSPCVPPALAELRRVGGDDEVAHHRQLAAAAQRETSHCRDHRLAHLAHGFPVARDEVGAVRVHEGLVGHRRDVGAGGKRLVVAGDDDAADAVVAVEVQQGGTELVHQRVVQRV